MRDPLRRRSARRRAAATVGAILLAGLLTPPALALRPTPPGVDPREVKIAAEAILCDCGCHPQSVHDCACGRADEMWNELAAEVAAGGPDGGPLDGEQVIAKWVAERGEKILVTPEASGFNLVAWLGPLVLLLVAAGVLIGVLRRWAGRGRPATVSADASPADLDPAVLARIRRDVEDLR